MDYLFLSVNGPVTGNHDQYKIRHHHVTEAIHPIHSVIAEHDHLVGGLDLYVDRSLVAAEQQYLAA